MKVYLRVVGMAQARDAVETEWPDGWPIPREGETVYTAARDALYVRDVSWWPIGDPLNDDPEPFVYVVIGPAR